MKKSFAAAVAAASVLFGSVVANAEPAAQSAVNAPASAPQKITIGNFTFSPATIEVAAGTPLQWINEDDVPHIVVGVEKGSPLKSPALDTDDRYAVVLSQPGTYHYFCSLHPHMTGTIIVRP